MPLLTEHFELSEFTRSLTAKRFKIANTPERMHILNLSRLCKNVLEPIRRHFGYPIHVNSGYRCPRLNSLVHGALHSHHLNGCAADITAADFSLLCDTVENLISQKIIRPVEVIFHDSYIHIAYV